MKLSAKGIELLKWVERLRLKPYDDQTGRTITEWCTGATIGYGHLISFPDWPLYADGIDEKEADFLFAEDLAPREAVVTGLVKVPLEQHQYDALVILLYNLGTRQLTDSSALKLINDPAAKTGFSNLEKAWKAFNKSQGKVNQGLINRRVAEWNLYSKGVYEKW